MGGMETGEEIRTVAAAAAAVKKKPVCRENRLVFHVSRETFTQVSCFIDLPESGLSGHKP